MPLDKSNEPGLLTFRKNWRIIKEADARTRELEISKERGMRSKKKRKVDIEIAQQVNLSRRAALKSLMGAAGICAVTALGVNYYTGTQNTTKEDTASQALADDPESAAQQKELIVEPENFPPIVYKIFKFFLNEKKIEELIGQVMGDSRDKRPFRIVWANNGYSEKYQQKMAESADAQVFKDRQLILFDGNHFEQYHRIMPPGVYVAHLVKRLIHELVHANMPCHFMNEHFEEGLAVYMERKIGNSLGLKETTQELNAPLDFKYTNKKAFAKDCSFVGPFEWLGGANYFNGSKMWEKLVEKDPDIIKKLLEEITRSGLKDSQIGKQKAIELLLKVNPELKALVDSFEFLSDFKLRNPQIVAFPLNFEKAHDGLMVVVMKRDEHDCDQVAESDYYKIRIVVNGVELPADKIRRPNKSELLIKEKVTGDVEIFAEFPEPANTRFHEALHIDEY
jgi:hypothetical protein